MSAPDIYFSAFNHLSEGIMDVWFDDDYWVEITVSLPTTPHDVTGNSVTLLAQISVIVDY